MRGVLALALALAACAHAFAPRAHVLPARLCGAPTRRVSGCSMDLPMKPPSPPENGFEAFVGSLFKAAEDAGKRATEATEQYINTGWQVKKRAGQVMPEIRPNAVDVQKKSAQILKPDAAAAAPAAVTPGGEPAAPAPAMGMAGTSGTLAAIDAKSDALLASQGSMELQVEFIDFLSAAESQGSYTTTKSGELVFASRDALAALVADFSYGKLRELAAAARALARYVDDLETELEAADDAVVALKREVGEGETRASELERLNTRLEEQAASYTQQIQQSQQAIDAQATRLAAAEKAAEEVASKLASSQARSLELSSTAAAAATDAAEVAEGSDAKAVELEAKLMAAEAEAEQLELAKARLESQIASLSTQQELAAQQREREQRAVADLEAKAKAAEERADAKAAELSSSLEKSQANAGVLQAQLDQLKAAQEKTPPPKPATTYSATVIKPERDDEPKRAPEAAPPAETLAAAYQNSATAEAPAPPLNFNDEAAALTIEIEGLLRDAEAADGASAPAGPSGAVRYPPLSRMKKAELRAECDERRLKVKASGAVAELRAVLRVERKRDKLVEQLTDRGWAEVRARSALDKSGWDVEAAIARLGKGGGGMKTR